MRNRVAAPSLTEMELKKVSEILTSGWIGPNGESVRTFESDLASCFGEKVYVLATSSGTAALHLALRAMDIRPGDYVLTPTLAYTAAAFAIRYCGAEPIFIGADEATWNMDLHYLEEAIIKIKASGEASKLKAILVVHNYGLPNDMDSIMTLATNYKLKVLEDAAEAFGSTYKGRPAGNLGDLGVFSFNANKIITTGGGGALIFKSQQDYLRCKSLANMSKISTLSYEHNDIGYNYAMNNIAAALGVCQLSRINELLHERLLKKEIYQRELGEFFSFQIEQDGYKSNNWLIAGIPKKPLKASLFQSKLIELRKVFSPLHLQKPFRTCAFFGKEPFFDAWQDGVCLPSGAEVFMDEVISEIEASFN